MTTTPTIEDRLRATLAAEADRHPVTPDLDALRTRPDHVIVDLRQPPRRNRARMLAAAVVLVVLALGAVAVVRASGETGDEDLPVASGAGATGYHLPGPGWEVVGVEVGGSISSGRTREVLFVPPTALEDGDQTRLQADVVPVTSLDGATERWQEAGATQVARAPGDHEVWMVDHSADDGSPPIRLRLLVPGDGEVLVLSSTAVDLQTLVDLADRWRDSEGREIALDPGVGLDRWSDQTRPDAPPVDAGPLAGGESEPGPTLEPLVKVTVEGPAGVRAVYSLAATGRASRPTGVGEADGGTGRGIEPESRRQRVDGLRDDGEVWSTPGGQGVTSLLGLLPAADVRVSADSAATTGRAGADDLSDLMAGLRPVDAATWATAVAAFPTGIEWPERLADLDADMVEASHTTEASGTAGAADTTEATDGTTTTTVPETRGFTTASSDLLGFATGAAVVPEAGVAPEVTVGFVGSTDADVVLTGDDRHDPDRWVLELDGRWGRDGPTSALELIAGVSTVIETRSPATPEPTCAGDEPPVEDLVVLTPEVEEGGSCLDWFGVVVRLDAEERIAEVRLALWEP